MDETLKVLEEMCADAKLDAEHYEECLAEGGISQALRDFYEQRLSNANTNHTALSTAIASLKAAEAIVPVLEELIAPPQTLFPMSTDEQARIDAFLEAMKGV